MSSLFVRSLVLVLLGMMLMSRVHAYFAEAKTVTTNMGTVSTSPTQTRLFLQTGTSNAAPLGTTVWFVADRAGDGVPTNGVSAAVLGSDDVLVAVDTLDGDNPGNVAGRYRRLTIQVDDALVDSPFYMYLWNGQGTNFVPEAGSTFGVFRIGVSRPPEIGNAPWLIDQNIHADQFTVGGGGGSTNRAPTIAAIAAQAVEAGQLLTVTVTAEDPDAGQSLRFSLVPPSAAGAEVNATNGTITWTPALAAVGTNAITVRAADNGQPSLFADRSFDVVVSAPAATNQPVIGVSLAGGDLALSFATQAGRTYRVQARTNLSVGDWELVGDGIAGTGENRVVNLPIGPTAERFFRILLP
jgi:hypothetical protein